jgi:tyrosine-protein phosphatase YwqE
MKLKKENLSLAGEYAVASEICRRNFYAQITLGHLKKADILVYNPETGKEIRIEVKSKQGKEWPGIRGINDNQTLLIFVDFENKKDTERPDFYILNAEDWQEFLKNFVVNNPNLSELIDNYIPNWKDNYKGVGVKPKDIIQHKERWDKIEKLLT